MARLNDWLNLAGVTFRSLEKRDVTQLYSLEWPEARAKLIEEHRADIEGDPRRVHRFVRTTSAVMYGLAKRLAPQRRVLFFAAEILGIQALVSLLFDLPLPVYPSFVVSFVLLTLLLGMELIDKIKFRDELELARDLQAGLIPKTLPDYEGFESDAYNRIANTVGGDIYDFVPLHDGRMAVLFGDASGHGMAAGLVMAVAHAAFRTQLDIDPSPAAVFGTLNRILCRTGGPRSFFAGVYLLLSPDGTFTTTVAGHPPILHVAGDGTSVRAIGTGAYPLGIKPSLCWEIDHGALRAGDALILHSDGLAEARNFQDKELGYARISETACSHVASSAHELLRCIVADYKAFTDGRAPEDDVSLAVIKRVLSAE